MLSVRKARPEAQEEQLLRLYWNRAGVKRELSTLRRERFDLLDRLKEQESAIVRAQEQLEGLERLLVDPVAAANAMVYFQLRHMWRVASLKVEQFSKELTAQRERRERARLQAEVIAKRERRQTAVREKLKELLHKRKNVIEERTALDQRLSGSNPIVRLFIGPGLRRRIAAARKNLEFLDGRVEEMNDLIEKIQGEPLPEPDGLSLDSRRLINVAVIALAQHLVVHFAEHDLAKLAKKAAERPVADMKFGDRRACDRMVELIRERVAELTADKRLADAVKRRTDYLMTRVQYRHDTDTMPRVELLASVQRNPGAGNIDAGSPARRLDDAPLDINVLADEYWDLYSSLT